MDLSLSEVLVIVVGLAAGYWLVSKFMPQKKTEAKFDEPDATTSRNTHSRDSSKQDSIKNEEIKPDWALVLGITQNASIQEIREAYRGLISQYHPDKVAQLGPELQKLAAEKSALINVAYQQAMKAQQKKQ